MSTNYRKNVPRGGMAMPPASPYIKHTPKPEMAMLTMVAKGDILGFGSWSLDEQGLLCIHGIGEMPDWECGWQGRNGNRPWEDVIEKIQFLRILTGVTSIGREAFRGCRSLTEIRFPDNLTDIYAAVLGDCGVLKEVHLPDSLIRIGEGVFYNCSSLKELHIPKTATELSNTIFAGCTGLQKVTMPAQFNCFFFKTKYGIPKNIVTFI